MSSAPTYIFQKQKLTENLIVGRNVYQRLEHKVDSRRLTHESSEDAVSWNVFVGLLALGELPGLFQLLTGRACRSEPELYLWGNRISTLSPSFWPDLKRVQQQLEGGKTIPTEPDIILRAPGNAIVVIEAKFGSPNSLFEKKQKRVGPIAGYLRRYKSKAGQGDPLMREWIYSQKLGVLEQLCRNAIYTHWLAAPKEDQFLVNLVLKRSESDVVERFAKHLAPDTIRFRRVGWEELYDLPAIHSPKGRLLRKYFQTKTLCLRKAFDVAREF